MVERARSPPSPSAEKPSVPRLAHPLALTSGGVFLISLLVQLLGVIGTIFLYKQIHGSAGAEIIGTAQLFLLIGSSINGLGTLRLGTAFTYFLARGQPPRESTSTYFLLRVMLVATSGTLLFFLLPDFVGREHLIWLGVFLSLPLFWSVATVRTHLFVGTGNSMKGQLPLLVEAIVRLPALFYVAYRMPTVEGITIAYAAGAIASAAFSVPSILPHLGKVHWLEGARMFRFAWPLMGSLLLNYLVWNMVPLIVNGALGAAQFSFFLAANGWRILVLSLPLAVTTPLFPYLAGLHHQREYESVRRVTWQALRYSAMLLVPGVVALVTYRFPFLNVFTNQTYAAAAALPLAILVAGAIPLALSNIIQSSINAIGRQRLELYITGTEVAVLLAGIALFLPPWGPFQGIWSSGVIAASVAVLLASSAALALNTFFMERLIRVHVHPTSIARITLSAAGAFGSFALINRLHLSFLNSTEIFPPRSAAQLTVAVLIGFIVYFFLLAAIGELTKDDVATIGRSLSLPPRLTRMVLPFCWRTSFPDLPPVDLSQAPGLRATELPEPFSGTTEIPELGDVPSPEENDAPPPER